MLSNQLKYRGLLAFAFLGIQTTFGAVFFQNADHLPRNAEYDFIIAGGGTGGGVVAGRLAENPNWKVLVIEAGPSNEDVFATIPPGLCGELPNTPVDWNYTISSPNGVPAHYARGKMLGGCSSHNGMVFTRGSRDDWDLWAEITGDDGLSWDNMMPFMLKAEQLVRDSENQPEEGHVDPSVHGDDGNLFVTSSFNPHPFNDMLLKATTELPDEFPFLLDMNAGRPIGLSWNLFTIDHNAERSSSATAYVETSGKNLHVLLNTYVTRVMPVKDDSTDFRKVEFAAGTESRRRQIVARKEVIVAGGVIGSPQLLMNSGIGNRDELEAVGVKTLVHNPGVGKNLTDQVYTIALFNTTIQDTDFDRDAALAEWKATRTGMMALTGHLKNQVAWVRLPDDAPPFSQDGFKDPSPGANSPHIEIYWSQITRKLPVTNGQVPLPPDDGNLLAVQLATINLHPASRGSITLNSSDPFTYPIIDLNLLSEDVDTAVLREGIKSTRRLMSAPVFADSVFGPVYPSSNVTSDEDIDAFIRAAAGPYLHGGCSVGMSPRGAGWGAVDPDFKVKGTKGLRVVDASVFPTIPSGHTQAPVYALAEHASMMIAKVWK